MGCEVYANGNAISCKAGDNKVIAAFPDVCLSPPSPPAGPIPLPYPNTSFSKDMKNGSKTVKIKGKEVMLKDQSYYNTSPLGDEAATKGLGAGVITHVITGKTYFVAWSMDVKFEDQNVDRHIDLTTSNHASPMANEPVVMPAGEGAAKSGGSEPKCDHEYDCKPVAEKSGKSIDEKVADKRANTTNAGFPFEAKAIEHNKADIQSGDDVSCSFKCKKCPLSREVDHITRDSSGNITKVVQCKSDQGTAAGTKGVIVDAKQLKESRKVVKAINECQKDSGVEAKLEYKLEAGDAANEAEKFLKKSSPPIVTMV